MKKIYLLFLSAGLFNCACQQAPRPIVQTEVPVYKTSKPTLTPVSGPEAKDWDIVDRTKAVEKYQAIPTKDKQLLFETVARVYSKLSSKNTYSCDAINTGIWKELTDKGIDLSFGEPASDWHPYLMYIQPIVVAEMTDIYLKADKEVISTKELRTWQKAIRNYINARPDNMTMAIFLNKRDALRQAGVIISEADGGYKAKSKRINWSKYRASLQK
jgi:hypothetical protein